MSHIILSSSLYVITYFICAAENFSLQILSFLSSPFFMTSHHVQNSFFPPIILNHSFWVFSVRLKSVLLFFVLFLKIILPEAFVVFSFCKYCLFHYISTIESLIVKGKIANTIHVSNFAFSK